MKTLEGAFNQEKALVGAFSVIVQPVVEQIDRFVALVLVEMVRGSATARVNSVICDNSVESFQVISH